MMGRPRGDQQAPGQARPDAYRARMAKGGADDVPDIAAGFTRVDAQPDTSVLVAGMDATARWPAVKQLRVWERTHLALGPGDRLLDVGCGPGDVAVELAADVGQAGSVLGVDASEAMISVARRRAAAAGGRVEFGVADAQSLPVADGHRDACRSERMLQWVPDTDRAAGELVRILRPGGRLVVTDTDWRSLAFDPSDAQNFDAVTQAIRALRGPGYSIGGRLLNLCRGLGLVRVACTAATHVWTEWESGTPTSRRHRPGSSRSGWPLSSWWISDCSTGTLPTGSSPESRTPHARAASACR